jgi:UDP-N-acetylmuramoyl-tripeptide--D-alanyl-D-alanine ligase
MTDSSSTASCRPVRSWRAVWHRGINALGWRLAIAGTLPMLIVAGLVRRTVGRRARVIVVVGTYGKTTTTRAIRAALGLPPSRWAEANANCLALVPLALLRGLWRSREIVIEVGIGAPEQMTRFAWALRPSVVVVTCIGLEHIQSFRDLDHLRDEKAAMVRSLAATGVAVLNGDDTNVMWMASQTRARVVTYGLTPGLDVRGTDLTLNWPHGTRLQLHAGGESVVLDARLVGDGLVHGLLAAAAVAGVEGRPLATVVPRLASMPATRGRLQPVVLPGGVTVLRDDYKSTPETVIAALDALAQVPGGRRITVLGDLDMPPPPERHWYKSVGEKVAQVADMALFVGTKFDRYRVGARAAGMQDDRMHHVRSVHEAITFLRCCLDADDVVLVKGRETQRLTRIILALAGRDVRCRIDQCRLHLTFCDDCPLLEHDDVPHHARPERDGDA